jgi:hypothetical protein
MGWLVALFLGIVAASAGKETQTSFDQRRAGGEIRFDVGWRNAAGRADRVSFALPAAAVDADKEEITWLPRREIAEHSARAVRAWGRTVPGVKITATVRGAAVEIGASGTGDVRGAMKEAARVREDAVTEWLADNAATRLDDQSLSFDHARLAAAYADAVAPMAAALREGAASDRAFVERALSFVQAIPYEARKLRGGDPGYRRPVALIARNRGDCDGKSVLFLAIVRAELPSVPLAVLYVPNHVLVGVGLVPSPGDKAFRLEGEELVYAEPVGPAQLPLGAKVERGHRIGRAEPRTVPDARQASR